MKEKERKSFRGLNLPENQLPDFVLQIASEVDAAWDEERRNYFGEPETIDSFRRIDDKVGRLSARVRVAAFDMYTKGDQAQQEQALKVIYCSFYPTIVSRADLIRRKLSQKYPEVVVEDKVLIESSLEIVGKIINRVAVGDLNIRQAMQRIDQDIPRMARGRIFVGKKEGILEELREKYKEVLKLDARGFNQGYIAEKVGLSRRGVGRIIRREKKRGLIYE